MTNSKLLNFIKGFLFLICFLYAAGISVAQTPIPVQSIPQVPLGSDSATSSLSAQFDGNLIGVTCGIPESLNRSEGTRCCSTNLNSSELLKEPEKSVNKFFCISDLPGLGAVTSVIETGIDIGQSVVCVGGLLCDDDSGSSTKVDLCLSDAVKVMLKTVFEWSPLI